jgi:hypothetical protein
MRKLPGARLQLRLPGTNVGGTGPGLASALRVRIGLRLRRGRARLPVHVYEPLNQL